MKKKSISKSAFINSRILIGVFLVLAGVLLALLSFGTFSNLSAQPNQENGEQPVDSMKSIRAVHSDLSLPLRDQPIQSLQAREEREPVLNPRLPIRHRDRPDPVIQSSFEQQLTTALTISAPILQWAGIAGQCEECLGVPDTNGAVGKTQYVEMVNKALQVFDKLTGTSLLGPIPIESVWTGFGGPCSIHGGGDPIVVYDRLADRWVISQFATRLGALEPQDECIAVSRTGDATGAWYRYEFHLTFRMSDYPKFGVWPDGYYMSANMFRTDPPPADPIGAKPFVFDRAKMLVGDPTATVQTTKGVVSDDFFLPSDLDGVIPPPTGAPNFFVAVTIAADELEAAAPGGARENAPSARTASTPPPKYKVWAFHVDWNDPDKSTFTLRANIPAADFTVLCPERDEKGECLPSVVPQLGVTQRLDALPDRLMFRNAYRRFPDGHESMLNNFTVSANSVAGIRWFELQRMHPGGWTLHQQSTYQPDNTWRWMGSIASDNQGNVALGFSASSETIHPQIRYAGRLATDPLGILSGEQHLFEGTGSQAAGKLFGETFPKFRWGDYSDMTIDPVDDCTFYYTNEYYAKTGNGARWKTRIGYFKFVGCTPPDKATVHFVAAGRGAPLSNAMVSIDNIPYGATAADGTYDAALPSGSHTYVVSNPAFGTLTGTFTVAGGQTTLVKPAFE